MSDLDDELRALLSERARRVQAGETVPPQLLRRARRSRVVSAALASGTVAGVLALASLGVAGVLREQGTPPPVVGPGSQSPGDGSWRGIWPQATREDAVRAQEAAAALDHDFRWQLSQRLVIERFAGEILGWDPYFVEEIPGLCADAGCETQRFHLGDCPAIQRGHDCTNEAFVFMAQLLRRDSYGIWFVTAARANGATVQVGPSPPPVVVTPPPPPTENESLAAELARAFLDARLRGSGAEDYLSLEALQRYEDGIGGLELYDIRWTSGSIPSPAEEVGGGRVTVWLEISRPMGECVESFYESMIVDIEGSHTIIEARMEDGVSTECS